MDKPFEVGDKVVLFGGFGHNEVVGFDKIKSVSGKRKDVILEKSGGRYDAGGYSIPRQRFGFVAIGHAEQKHYDQVERDNIIYRAKELDYAMLSIEQLRNINDVVKPHYDRQKAARQAAESENEQ